MIRFVRHAGACAALLALTSCGLLPSDAADPGGSGASIDKSSVQPPKTVVADAWQPGDFREGIHILWYDNPNDTAKTLHAKADRVLDYLVDLGANSIAVSFPLFTAGPDASTVHAGPKTPTPKRLRIVVEEAHQRGLRVSLRPLLDEANMPGGDYRGTISPADPGRWFASYESFLAPYLRMAQVTKTETFVIGAEFVSMVDRPGWDGVLALARSLYDKELSYSVNFNRPATTDPKPLPVDKAGLDAYFRSPNLVDDATVAEVADAWRSKLEAADSDLSKAVVHEAGIAAQDGAYARPFVWDHSGADVNERIQRRWFAGACRAVRQHGMDGIFYWTLSFHAEPAAKNAHRGDPLAFVGRPAEKAIRNCFERPKGTQ